VSGTAPALILAAAGVGFGHAVMPDHWAPLAVVGRTRGYPLARVARLSGLAGVAHVLVSLLLGGFVILIGLQFRASLEHAQNTIVGAVLVTTGAAFLALELAGLRIGHSHADGDHNHGRPQGHGRAAGPHRDGDHSHAHLQRAHSHEDGMRGPHPSPPGRTWGLAGVMVPFGAAASPDLTILPVFLAACAAGAGAAVGSLLAFASVTILTIVFLTILATVGGHQVRGRWLDRWGNAVTAATLLVIGALVLTGTI